MSSRRRLVTMMEARPKSIVIALLGVVVTGGVLIVGQAGPRRSKEVAASRGSMVDVGKTEAERGAGNKVALAALASIPAVGRVEQDAPSEEVRRGSITISGVEYNVTWEGNVRTVFFPGGEIFSRGEWVEGKRVGMHISWHSNGQEHGREPYKSGQRDGLCRYYASNGVLISEGVYSKEKQVGVWTTWWNSGAIQSLGFYEENELQGLYQFWLWDGSVDKTLTGDYEQGEKVGS